MKTHRYASRHRLFVCTSVLLMLTLLLVACGGTPPSRQARTPTPTTVAMPPTQTSCPTAGTARRAVIAPLVLGSRANVVYVYNQGRDNTPHPLVGILKRYDSTTRSETVILTAPHTSIDQAQVSADGQWVVFSTQVADRSALQLVRMDGQGLQTLYCGASNEQIGALAWSPDQQYMAFQEGVDVYLLKMATGAYQLKVASSTTMFYGVRTWLDDTHLYLAGLGVGTETPPLNLYLLDINTAKIQQILSSPTFCGDFDRSVDGRNLLTSECQFVMPMAGGPSSIRVQPATGGPAKTIYTTLSYAITSLRVASNTSLLFFIHNTGVGSIDTSHNGLWKVNTDGSRLTRLTHEAADEVTGFAWTRTPWSAVSRDGRSYTVQVSKYAISSTGTISPFMSSSLLIGSMSGGQPVAFTTLTHNSRTMDTLDLVGFTMM